MPKTPSIDLGNGVNIPILYEDRSILAIDKPKGWMLIPQTWDKTDRNLQLALQSSINAGDFWARSRGLRYLRFVHRLDTETTGVLMFAKTPGALKSLSALFAGRKMHKVYLAVTDGIPKSSRWVCDLPISSDENSIGRRKIDRRLGKPAWTEFRVVEKRPDRALIEARPVTGRTHQIRLHLAAAGHAILGDRLYSNAGELPAGPSPDLALRAVSLSYLDPFRKNPVCIRAPIAEFKKRFGFDREPRA